MKIAVVTATFQRQDGTTPKVLKRALDALNLQTYQDWKLFLIGDAYPDQDEFNSYKNYVPKDKIYIENLPISIERETYPNPSDDLWHVSGITPVNVGISQALKEGYEYIALLDHDDIWLSNHLKLIVEGIEKTGSPFIFTKGYYKLGNKIYEIPHPNYSPDKYKKLMINKDKPIYLNHVIPSYACYPTECVFLKTSVCFNGKTIELRMRDRLAETGRGGPGDADWWMRIRQEMINKKYKPALFIDFITCANVNEGYSKTKV